MTDFLASSSQFADALGGIWKSLYSLVKPLVDAADGGVKLLKLVK